MHNISFIHCGDLHLGYHQYNHEQRFDDFGRSFAHIVEQAIEEGVDYFLIAGDLFNKRSINSRTLMQAIEQLDRLKQADIPVIAIEGNHDKAPYGDHDSWMWFLNQQGYFYLLTPFFEDGQMRVTSWQEEERQGTVLSFPGIRFIGLGYQGSMTATRVKELAEQLDHASDFTVLLLHSAVDQLLHLGGIRSEDLAPLKDRVDYIAMGHVHGRYEVEDWVYNPGAPECWDVGEASKEKGFYMVNVDGKEKQVEHRPSVRRPVWHCHVNVSACTEVEDVYHMCRSAIKEEGEKAKAEADDPLASMVPIVRLVLAGTLPFSPLTLDVKKIEEDVQEEADSLIVEVINEALLQGEELIDTDAELEVNRETLEQDVLHKLVTEEAVPKPFAAEMVAVTKQAKELILREADEETLADLVEPLAEKMVQAEEMSETQVEDEEEQLSFVFDLEEGEGK